ncbi:MAG: rhomboid family intramembrane serine protease [Merismopedia sp. SIO2A8]|nr:rhomboid family intramembrane serine protease [Merismopedia sp. SIO2A8]
MVPLRDENPTTITPYVTFALIAVNIAVFFHQISLNPDALEAFIRMWGVVPARITAHLNGAASDSVWITLVSSQFLHANLLHLGGNMLYLWIFGNNIEDKLGHTRYLVFYLVCGVLAALSQWFFFQQGAVPMVGASGAIAGVMGAYIIRFPSAKILTFFPMFFFFTFKVPAYVFLGFWFVQQALFSVGTTLAAGGGEGGVAYWAHAGGFVFGALLGPMFGLMDDQPPQRRR